jgi:hypothetical protein
VRFAILRCVRSCHPRPLSVMPLCYNYDPNPYPAIKATP